MQLIFHLAIYFSLFLISFFRIAVAGFYSTIPRWSMCIAIFLFFFLFACFLKFPMKCGRFFSTASMNAHWKSMHLCMQKEEFTCSRQWKGNTSAHNIKTKFIACKTFLNSDVMRHHESWFIVSFDIRCSCMHFNHTAGIGFFPSKYQMYAYFIQERQL